MTNGIASRTNGITSDVTLLPCGHCGGEASIALHSNEFDEYWWSVQRGPDDATACKCRLFMESDWMFSLEEGEKPEDSPWAMELRARLVEKWNTRAEDAASIEMAQRIQSLELECAKLQEELRKAWNRVGLTAEQVRECAERVYLEGYSDGSMNRGAHIEETDWQAIADELNAMLGGGECELVYGENDYGDDGWWCQSCGEWFAASFRHTGRNNIIEPRYCQQCGKAVKQ